jgi:hypothetical protein
LFFNNLSMSKHPAYGQGERPDRIERPNANYLLSLPDERPFGDHFSKPQMKRAIEPHAASKQIARTPQHC